MAEYKWGAGGGGSGGRDASQIIYDNTQSGLAANNVQAAIDEVVQDLQDVANDAQDALDAHTSNTSNPHAVTKAQVGLSEVDNTSDVNKPVSAATQLALDLKIALTQKGAAFGVAPLNASAKISVDYFPAEMLGNLRFIDVWDASVGTYPTPAFDGNFWIVDVAGIISGTQYYVGDWILYANSAYNRIDNSQLVTSVNGLQGIVVLDTDDISEGSVNKYFTDALARTAAVVNSLAGSETDKAPSVAAVNTALAGKEPTITTLPIAKGGTGAATKSAAFDALSPATTKGDLIVHNGTTSVRLPAGTNGQILEYDDTTATGLKAATFSALTNPMTSVGDLIVGGSSGTPTRLGPNTSTTKKWLSQTGTGSAGQAPVWDDLPSASGTVAGTVTGNNLIPSDGSSAITATGRNSEIVVSANNTALVTGAYSALVFHDFTAAGNYDVSAVAFFERNGSTYTSVRHILLIGDVGTTVSLRGVKSDNYVESYDAVSTGFGSNCLSIPSLRVRFDGTNIHFAGATVATNRLCMIVWAGTFTGAANLVSGRLKIRRV